MLLHYSFSPTLSPELIVRQPNVGYWLAASFISSRNRDEDWYNDQWCGNDLLWVLDSGYVVQTLVWLYYSSCFPMSRCSILLRFISQPLFITSSSAFDSCREKITYELLELLWTINRAHFYETTSTKAVYKALYIKINIAEVVIYWI